MAPSLFLLPFYVYFCNIYTEQSIYWSLLLVFSLATFAAQGLAHVIVLLAPRNLFTVILLNLLALVVSLVLSNVPISLDRMHYVYQMIASLSYSRFAIEGSLLLEYGFGRCEEGQIQALLMWMGLADDGVYYYWCLFMLIVNGVFYRLVALWLLVRFANPNEKKVEKKIANFCQDGLDVVVSSNEKVSKEKLSSVVLI